MRRSEYKIENEAEFDKIAQEAHVGYLGIITPDDYPRVIPMNFVADDRTIYFHGADEGEKCAVLRHHPKVTFSIDIAYSYIPSYWTSKISAGTATMFYKSALIKGRGKIVDDPDEKSRALNLLMDKYQPEGGFTPISIEDKVYRHLFKATAVFRIDPEQIDIKINFRRKKSREYNLKLIEKLETRGAPVDFATAAEIRKMLDEQ